MTDDEIYLACLLTIGKWDFTVEQVTFLCDQNRQRLGRAPTLDENMAFVQGYRKYCSPSHNAHLSEIGKLATNAIVKPMMNKLIDTHTVGK